MSDTAIHPTDATPGSDSVAEAGRVEGQLIMPFYLVCDVSGSMRSSMDDLNAVLRQLRSDIMTDPVVDDLTMLSVITFASQAQTVVPLAPPSEITLPVLRAGGGTNYGAAFREYHRVFEADRARLKGEGKKVYRPCVFFLSDGAPGDRDYLATFRSLLSYNRATQQGNKAFPYVVTFGFRDAPQEVVQQLAYPDFGSAKGRWFLLRNTDVGTVLKAIATAIGNTVISSGLSASTGTALIVPPTLDPSTGAQFGEAGDYV